MAKTGDPVQKLRQKAKQYALKHKLGNEKGLLSRAGGENYYNRQILDDRRAQLAKYKNNAVIDGDMPDKPEPKKPEPKDKPALPRVAGWKPRGFGKRHLSGCVYRPR